MIEAELIETLILTIQKITSDKTITINQMIEDLIIIILMITFDLEKETDPEIITTLIIIDPILLIDLKAMKKANLETNIEVITEIKINLKTDLELDLETD